MLNDRIEHAPPQALQQLRKLHSLTPSHKLNQYLASFRNQKDQTLDIFIAGIEKFTYIANLGADERIQFLGNQFLGLHYNNDLAKLWNDCSSEKIKAHQLNRLSPLEWDSILEDGYLSFIYRGDTPAEALDKLLQGPTVIDCGMFCQLSIWFGIRYMLGDERFNQVFGNTPFYITQVVYQKIEDPTKPYMGNSLHPFFTQGLVSGTKSVEIIHIPNHPLYQLKHAGGNYGGENCVVIDGTYTIFDPNLPKTSGLREDEVEELLRESFNAPQNVNDANRVALYKETPETMHPKLGFTFQTLIEMSQTFTSLQVDVHAWKASDRIGLENKLQFDLEKFNLWLEQINKNIAHVDYHPLKDHQLRIHSSLIEQIPFENRNNMTFSAFKTDTPLQQEMLALSLQFCQNLMSSQSCSVILTGKAGIGKTASAVSCAKELTSRDKKVIWISEVTVRGWMDKAESLAEVEACRENIKLLLRDNPDAIFLDDDNLVGYSGKVLLEEIYAWYVSNPGKGLFITSNEDLTFKDCYGLKLDEKYHCPPFPGYTSPAYQNTIIRRGLQGQSLRASPVLDVTKLTDDVKITMLSESRAEQSIGIIVDRKIYETSKNKLGSVEFIPEIDESLLVPIRQSLRATGCVGAAYQKLNDHQKKWLRQFQVGGAFMYMNDRSVYEHPFQSITVKPFGETRCDTIAIELAQYKSCFEGVVINDDSMQQLLRVINYAHDRGGKKVIIINCTDFSQEELIAKIKAQIPKREKERTVARLENLLFSPSLTLSFQTINPKQDAKEETSPRTAKIVHDNGVRPSLFRSILFTDNKPNNKVYAAFNNSKNTTTKFSVSSKNVNISKAEFNVEVKYKHPNLGK